MKKKTRRKYTDEFKNEAVNLVTEQGYKTIETARNLGIHDAVLRRWIKERSPETNHSSSDIVKLQAELKRVRRENERLKMEREILKNGGSLLRERISMRFHFINTVKKAYPICLLCKVMQVSRSGYYSWKKRAKSTRDQERERLIPKVREIHKKNQEVHMEVAVWPGNWNLPVHAVASIKLAL